MQSECIFSWGFAGVNPLRHRCAMPPPPKGGGFTPQSGRCKKLPPRGSCRAYARRRDDKSSASITQPGPKGENDLKRKGRNAILGPEYLIIKDKGRGDAVWNFGKSRCRTSSASRRRRSARMCRRFCFFYRTFFQDQIMDILRIFGLTSVILPSFRNSLFTNVS